MSGTAAGAPAHTPDELFAILGNGTRLAILDELWRARGHSENPSLDALPFSELRKRVGMRDSAQFNYHLKQLVGPFVRRTDDGYALTRAGERVMSAVFAESLSDGLVLDAVPIDDPCPLCEGRVVLDCGTDAAPYLLLARCTECPGAWREAGLPSGILMSVDPLLPVGVSDRSLEEMYRAQYRWTKYSLLSMMDGVCPECSGPVTSTARFCETHPGPPSPPTLCDDCDTIFPLLFFNVCGVCNNYSQTPVDRHLLTHPTVAAFYADRGYDTWGHDWLRIQVETVREVVPIPGDPPSFRVVVTVDGDRLEATLDEGGR
ncbi:ArsR family transcriptional regulator, partial [Halobium palmae]